LASEVFLWYNLDMSEKESPVQKNNNLNINDQLSPHLVDLKSLITAKNQPKAKRFGWFLIKRKARGRVVPPVIMEVASKIKAETPQIINQIAPNLALPEAPTPPSEVIIKAKTKPLKPRPKPVKILNPKITFLIPLVMLVVIIGKIALNLLLSLRLIFNALFRLARRFNQMSRNCIVNTKQLIRRSPKAKNQEPPENILEVLVPVEAPNKVPVSLFSMVAFTLVLLVLIVPFVGLNSIADAAKQGGVIIAKAKSALSEILLAKDATAKFDFTSAGKNLEQASTEFSEAQGELSKINGLLLDLAKLAPNQQLKLAGNSKDILTAGTTATELGAILAKLADTINNLVAKKIDLSLAMSDGINQLSAAVLKSDSLVETMQHIDASALPSYQSGQFIAMREKAIVLRDTLKSLQPIVTSLSDFIGIEMDRRYLIIFQNNAEMRGSGGFLGSYALVDFSKGKIKKIEVPGGGSYDTEGGLLERIAAPEPLRLVNPLWHFWDANWWPDFPTTAKKLSWFLEKSQGPTVDGVISLTPNVIEDVLRIIGPITIPEENNLEITADNFWLNTQTIAEAKSPTNQPKKIIGSLINVIMQELPKRLDKEKSIALASVLNQNLKGKQIMFYAKNESVQASLDQLDFSGRIKDTNWDYLQVVNTNIAGGKSDRKISETITHQAEIQADGSIIDTVMITRKHTGVKGEEFTGRRNVDWVRIYVPYGSQFISAQGFTAPDQSLLTKPDPSWKLDSDLINEAIATIDKSSQTKIYQEAGKTVFANWSMVDPGQENTVWVTYKLPISLKNKTEQTWLDQISQLLGLNTPNVLPYALLVQKQPGSQNSQLDSTLRFAAGANQRLIGQWPDQLKQPDGWSVNHQLDSDQYLAGFITN